MAKTFSIKDGKEIEARELSSVSNQGPKFEDRLMFRAPKDIGPYALKVTLREGDPVVWNKPLIDVQKSKAQLAKEQEELAKKKAEEEKKLAEELAKKKAEEEALAKKKADEELAKQKALEEAKKKEQEELAKKKAEEEAKKKEQAEIAAKKKAEEELAKKLAEEAAKKKAEEELAKKKAEAELAKKKAEDEAKRKIASAKKTYLVSIERPRSGKIVSRDGKINCGISQCYAEYKEGATVTLKAVPDGEHEIEEWSGDCEGSNLQCTLVINEDKKIGASFAERERSWDRSKDKVEGGQEKTGSEEEREPAAQKICDPNAPMYTQRGCRQEGGTQEEKSGEPQKCDPTAPSYSQKGCIP